MRMSDVLRKKVKELNGELPAYCTAELTRHGRVAIYFRRIGKTGRIRMRAEAGGPDFHRQYAALLEGRVPARTGRMPPASAAHGTWRWLCQNYFASAQFKDLQALG